jgi:hypothetical protein
VNVEGIRDGHAGDECFVCGLLWPGARPCRRCGGRMRWSPATMLDENLALIKVGRALDTWRSRGGREALEELLEIVHAGGSLTVDALHDMGGDLDELRRAYARLAPEHASW